MYKLKSFIDPDKLNWKTLSSNSLAIDLLEQNMDKVSWLYVSSNPNALHLIHKGIKENKKIDWQLLSKNEGAIHLLEQNPEKIDWQYVSANPKAIHLLEQNPEKINWGSLSLNPNAIHLLEKHPYKIDWLTLSGNPSAIDLLKQYPEKIIMHFFCRNPNPKVIHFLEKTAEAEWEDVIDWGVITLNPNALCIIEKNLDKIKTGICHMSHYPNNVSFLEKNPHFIDWWFLSMNPGIFELDYEALKTRTGLYRDELLAFTLDPKRMKPLFELARESGKHIDDYT